VDINNTKRHNRFLQADCRFDNLAIEIWQRECKSRCAKKEKTEAYFNYINWKPTAKEIALFTLYSTYKELSIPNYYDCIFDFNQPNIYNEAKFELTQIIWEAWHPLDKMVSGHKHLAIFKYEGDLPKLISSLHIESNKFSTTPIGSLLIGICKMENYSIIKKRIETIKQLRIKHGPNWGDYFKGDLNA